MAFWSGAYVLEELVQLNAIALSTCKVDMLILLNLSQIGRHLGNFLFFIFQFKKFVLGVCTDNFRLAVTCFFTLFASGMRNSLLSGAYVWIDQMEEGQLNPVIFGKVS